MAERNIAIFFPDVPSNLGGEMLVEHLIKQMRDANFIQLKEGSFQGPDKEGMGGHTVEETYVRLDTDDFAMMDTALQLSYERQQTTLGMIPMDLKQHCGPLKEYGKRLQDLQKRIMLAFNR